MMAYMPGQKAEEKAKGDLDILVGELVALKAKMHEVWTRAALAPSEQDQLARLLNQMPTEADFLEILQ